MQVRLGASRTDWYGECQTQLATPKFSKFGSPPLMTILQSITLGIIQGLGEFLPISSSGHLVLTPWLFGWQDPGLVFDVALHLGTFLAAVFYFRHDLAIIIRQGLKQLARKPSAATSLVKETGTNNKIEKRKEAVSAEEEDKEVKEKQRREIKKIEASENNQTDKKYPGGKIPNYPPATLWFLALATIPGALAGLLLDDQAETIFRNPLLIAGTLSILGLLLYWVDKVAQKNQGLGEIKSSQALIIGLAQALAIVPGVSRSGVTITAARALKIDRASAARFSFLLSLPIILGASLFKLDEFLEQSFGLTEWLGVAAAAISGYLAIAGLIKFIQKSSYAIFFWYRLVLAALIVILWIVQV